MKPLRPFSLTCLGCEAGDDMHSEEQALAAGWIHIERDDGFSWNYLGCCPECREEWYGETMVCALKEGAVDA